MVTSTRADYSKLRGLMLSLDRDPSFELVPLVIGTHLLLEGGHSHKLVESDFPNCSKLNTIVAGDTLSTMADSVALTLSKTSQFFATHEVDMVVVHGDRFDAFGVASAATLMHIFTVHLEGGEKSGTIDGTLRHAISKLSHLHFTATELARETVVSMGESENLVHYVGCPTYDEYQKAVNGPSNIEQKENILTSMNVKSKQFVIIMHHPTTFSSSDSEMEYKNILDAVDTLDIRAVLFYPNIDHGNKRMISILHAKQASSPSFVKNVSCHTNLKQTDFILLLKECSAIVGNSSAIIRESCFFGIPAVNVGSRQKGRVVSSNVAQVKGDSMLDIVACVQRQMSTVYEPSFLYGSGGAVQSMMKVLSSVDFTQVTK